MIVTGGMAIPVDHLFDGPRHVEIPVERYGVAATHGAGLRTPPLSPLCLARGLSLADAARGAAAPQATRFATASTSIGAGEALSTSST